MDSAFLTLPEVAERYRVPVPTVKRLVADGKIAKPKRIGVQLRFAVVDLGADRSSA